MTEYSNLKLSGNDKEDDQKENTCIVLSLTQWFILISVCLVSIIYDGD